MSDANIGQFAKLDWLRTLKITAVIWIVIVIGAAASSLEHIPVSAIERWTFFQPVMALGVFLARYLTFEVNYNRVSEAFDSNYTRFAHMKYWKSAD